MAMKSISKKNMIFAGIILCLLLIGIIGCIYVVRAKADHCIAHIYQCGEEIQTIDLDAVSEAYTFDVEGADGAVNTIEVRPGEIAIISATCPDKVCVNAGFIHNPKLPITCMPNQVMIKLTDTTDASEVDGLSY